jgi:hypothetical protein
MHIARAKTNGIRFDGEIFQLLCIRRLSTNMNIIANTAAKKLNTVNAIAAIDVPPYNSVISTTWSDVKGIVPETLNIPVSVLMTDIISEAYQRSV